MRNWNAFLKLHVEVFLWPLFFTSFASSEWFPLQAFETEWRYTISSAFLFKNKAEILLESLIFREAKDC